MEKETKLEKSITVRRQIIGKKDTRFPVGAFNHYRSMGDVSCDCSLCAKYAFWRSHKFNKIGDK